MCLSQDKAGNMHLKFIKFTFVATGILSILSAAYKPNYFTIGSLDVNAFPKNCLVNQLSNGNLYLFHDYILYFFSEIT